MIKEIERLTHIEVVNNIMTKPTPVEIVNKLNEIIEAVNALIITHPRLEESANQRREFQKHVEE